MLSCYEQPYPLQGGSAGLSWMFSFVMNDVKYFDHLK